MTTIQIFGIGILFLVAIIIMGSISAARKKKQEEKDRKNKVKADIKKAYENSEIFGEHYEQLKTKFESTNSSELLSSFDKAKSEKKRIDNWLAKYPKNEVEKMLRQEYWIGMTEQQLIECKGNPTKIELEQLKTKTKRIFVYGNKSSGDVFNFVDGTLERFKDR